MGDVAGDLGRPGEQCLEASLTVAVTVMQAGAVPSHISAAAAMKLVAVTVMQDGTVPSHRSAVPAGPPCDNRKAASFAEAAR